MLFDTHSHLNFKAFDQDRDEVIKKCLREGVFLINVGSDYENSKLAIELAEKYKHQIWDYRNHLHQTLPKEEMEEVPSYPKWPAGIAQKDITDYGNLD